MIDQGFSNGNSLIHGFDPRARLTVALFFSIMVAVADRFPALLIALALSMMLVIAARLETMRLFSRLMAINLFIVLFWLVIPFTMEGDVLFRVGPLNATLEGIIFSLVITLKSNAISLCLMALVGIMPVFTMGRAMGYLFIPRKIIHLLLFTFRYIHVIQREYVRRMNAIRIRGFRAGTNMHTYRTFAYLFGMLLINSYDRAERVRSAMLCRGFNGRFYDLHSFNFTHSDLVLLILMLAGVSFIGIVQWTEVIF